MYPQSSIPWPPFWQKHPALPLGLACLLGCLLGLGVGFTLFIPLSFFLWTIREQDRTKVCVYLTSLLLSCCWVISHIQLPSIPTDGLEGEGHLSISSIRIFQNHTGRYWVYEGTVDSWKDSNGESWGKNLPCRLYLPQKGERPSCSHIYEVKGLLKEGRSGGYILKSSAKDWISIGEASPLCEWRQEGKEAFRRHAEKLYTQKEVLDFFVGMSTGQFHERELLMDFSQLGLQHIMVVSGMHFSLLAVFLAFILRFFLPYRLSLILLIILLSAYSLFVGCSPSIQRAWVMALCHFAALALGRQSNALNSLGAALAICSLWNPSSCLQIGFYLSFGVTFSLIVFYHPLEQALCYLLSSRRNVEILSLGWPDRILYFVNTFLRKALALSLAAYTLAIPLLLFDKQYFPLAGVCQNLFLPFLLGACLFLFLLSCLLPFLAGPCSFTCLNCLNLVEKCPASLQWGISCQSFPVELVLLYGCGLLWLAAKRRPISIYKIF